jgi:hypothetical protein
VTLEQQFSRKKLLCTIDERIFIVIMTVIIQKPTKNPMQSGLAKTKSWQIINGGDQKNPTQPLYFTSKDEAVEFSQSKGWQYIVKSVHKKSISPKRYVPDK